MSTPIVTSGYGATAWHWGSRGVAVSTVGYLCFGLAGWMISMSAAGWYPGPYALGLLFPLSVVLGAVAILGFVCGRGLDSIIFFTGALLFWTTNSYMDMVGAGRPAQPASFLGWFACLFAIFFGYIWAASFRSGLTRSIFLLGTWVTLILAAIDAWTGTNSFYVASGYVGLFTSAVAMVASANEVIRFGGKVNPNVETTGPSVKPMAAD